MAKKSKSSESNGRKVVSRNRRARHDYNLESTYDAGLVLMGSEIKSIRDNKVNLMDGFVQERNGELWLMNAHIAPYDKAPIYGHTDPRRPRKLLLHKREISQILTRIRERSYTAVPLTLYLERGLAKVEIAIARGKKQYDKRAAIAERDAQRDIQRALKDR